VATAHESFPNGSATLDPPSFGQAPADPTAAWNRIAAALPGNPCRGAKAEAVQFGLFTHGYPVPEPAYNKTPEWILRCIDNPASPGITIIPPGQHSPPPTAASARQFTDFIWVLDARTGKLLLGWTESAS
jgi:hypothetical protein